MRRLLSLAAAFLFSGAAAAQSPPPASAGAGSIDWCALPLGKDASSRDVMDWRLHCAVQKLDTERAAAEDRAIEAEVEAASAKAREAAAQAELDALKKMGAMPVVIRPPKK
jgi:hypothetical protein